MGLWAGVRSRRRLESQRLLEGRSDVKESYGDSVTHLGPGVQLDRRVFRVLDLWEP